MDSPEEIDKLNGAESFLVGLSPQYWACTPMSVEDFNGLLLVGGIDCIVTEREQLDEAGKENVAYPTRFLPVSKCSVVGVIVNATHKSGNAYQYLVDDGTGVVDCLAWTDTGMYSLPSLVESPAHSEMFHVGDLVRVFGRIRTVSIGKTIMNLRRGETSVEITESVREIHASLIEKVTHDEQAHHWLRCLEFQQECGDKQIASTEKEGDRRISGPQIKNGTDVLRLLGKTITTEALSLADFPAANDDVGAWRVFGVGCQCKFAYMESLLYCHCQATPERLDPKLLFRDQLLLRLLALENETNQELRFLYNTIAQDASVRAGAKAVVGDNTMLIARLLLRTFSALRKDGILFLLDEESDTHLLVSRRRVLEPCLERMSTRRSSGMAQRLLESEETQSFLRCVPSSRMQFVRKSVR